MKATLKYDLPDEETDFKLAMHGKDLMAALYEFDQEVLRRYIKYDDTLSDKEYDLVDKIRGQLYEIMEANDVSFSLWM